MSVKSSAWFSVSARRGQRHHEHRTHFRSSLPSGETFKDFVQRQETEMGVFDTLDGGPRFGKLTVFRLVQGNVGQGGDAVMKKEALDESAIAIRFPRQSQPLAQGGLHLAGHAQIGFVSCNLAQGFLLACGVVQLTQDGLPLDDRLPQLALLLRSAQIQEKSDRGERLFLVAHVFDFPGLGECFGEPARPRQGVDRLLRKRGIVLCGRPGGADLDPLLRLGFLIVDLR